MLSTDRLVQRLSVEVATATERIQSLQKEAGRAFVEQEQRFLRFMALTDSIHEILHPRLETFLQLNVFKDVTQFVRLSRRSGVKRGFHERTTTLSVPASDACSGKVELSFRLGHDGSITNAILDYRLEILPIFIEFESHDQLFIPVDNPDEDAIAAWIDDKLVGFTQTYFEMYFTEQYQKQSFTRDPVMNIRFPKAYAAGKQEYKGQTYYFYANESLQAFIANPEKYVETRVHE